MEPSSDSTPLETPDGEWVAGYPWWVRVLAVLHVLSRVLAPALFFILAVAAGVMVMRRGQVDGTVMLIACLALVCPAVGMIFRRWFERWGQRHYPQPPSDPQEE